MYYWDYKGLSWLISYKYKDYLIFKIIIYLSFKILLILLLYYIIICNFLINFCKKKIVLDNDM